MARSGICVRSLDLIAVLNRNHTNTRVAEAKCREANRLVRRYLKTGSLADYSAAQNALHLAELALAGADELALSASEDLRLLAASAARGAI